MDRHTTLARATLLAAVFAAPATALADRPTEEVAFYYNRIAFQYASGASDAPATTPMLTPIDPLPAKVDDATGANARKGGWILDTGRDPIPAPSSKPKEIVVVGSKLPAAPSGAGSAARREHPDFAWRPVARPSSGTVPASPPVAAPKPQPQPYTLIELLNVKTGRAPE